MSDESTPIPNRRPAPLVPPRPAADEGAAAAPTAQPAKRKRLLLIVAMLVLFGAIGYGAYWALVLNHFESTDNAYVQGNVVQITPQIAGTVVAIEADETDAVKAGQPLLRLDAADAEVALLQAQAQLAQAVREVRTLYVNNQTLGAQISQRQADLSRTEIDLGKAQEDAARRAPLLASGAISQEDLAHAQGAVNSARSAVQASQSALSAAREQLSAGQTLTDGIHVEQHPNVLRAAARVREVYLALHRSTLPAPIDGVIAKRTVQIGQRVQAGAPLMTLVALDTLWVDANFKESQLGRLRVGQPATLQADVYGSKTTFHGKLAGLGAGTGAAFALLPAQNATGNWIKVVQRVPVRIMLDAKELAIHPLRIGLSMEVQVDIANTQGAPLAAAPRSAPVAQTAVFDTASRVADEQVQKIIRANLGRPAGMKQ